MYFFRVKCQDMKYKWAQFRVQFHGRADKGNRGIKWHIETRDLQRRRRRRRTRQDSHPSNRHAAACAGDFFLHDRESRRGRLRWQCKKEEGEEKTIRPNAESGSHILLN